MSINKILNLNVMDWFWLWFDSISPEEMNIPNHCVQTLLFWTSIRIFQIKSNYVIILVDVAANTRLIVIVHHRPISLFFFWSCHTLFTVKRYVLVGKNDVNRKREKKNLQKDQFFVGWFYWCNPRDLDG